MNKRWGDERSCRKFTHLNRSGPEEQCVLPIDDAGIGSLSLFRFLLFFHFSLSLSPDSFNVEVVQNDEHPHGNTD